MLLAIRNPVLEVVGIPYPQQYSLDSNVLFFFSIYNLRILLTITMYNLHSSYTKLKYKAEKLYKRKTWPKAAPGCAFAPMTV